MFLIMDIDVIEVVLRFNDGVVDDIIDQLLIMSIDFDDRDFVDIFLEFIFFVCLLVIICYINVIVYLLYMYVSVICEYLVVEKY